MAVNWFQGQHFTLSNIWIARTGSIMRRDGRFRFHDTTIRTSTVSGFVFVVSDCKKVDIRLIISIDRRRRTETRWMLYELLHIIRFGRILKFDLTSTPHVHPFSEKLVLSFPLFGRFAISGSAFSPEWGTNGVSPNSAAQFFVATIEFASRC